jgi:hypothetical protein
VTEGVAVAGTTLTVTSTVEVTLGADNLAAVMVIR